MFIKIIFQHKMVYECWYALEFYLGICQYWMILWQINICHKIIQYVRQNPIPNVWQMVFAYISIKGWIIDPYIQGLFDGPHEVLVISPQYGKIVNTDRMTRGVNMVMYRGRALRCSLNLSSKFLADSPIYSSSQSTLLHLYLYMTPLF